MGSNVATLPQVLLNKAAGRTYFNSAGLLALATLMFVSSYCLRFDFNLDGDGLRTIALTLPLLLVTRWFGFVLFDIDVRSFQRASLADLLPIVSAVTLSSTVFACVVHMVTPELGFPRSVIIMDWALLQLALFSVYAGAIVLREASPMANVSRQRAILVGSTESVAAVLRDVREAGRWNPVGVLTEDYDGRRARLQGVPVSGSVEMLIETAVRCRANLVCFAHPGIETRRLMELMRRCREHNLDFVVQQSRSAKGASVQKLGTEVLLQREEVSIDLDAVRNLIRGRRVLVTGAGGSIGSELCRQIAALAPAALYMVERSENNLFFVHREIAQAQSGLELHPLLLDITDEDVLCREFALARPEIVFHAAAHKHVGMMERRPQEAIRNNVIGTYNVAAAAAKCGALRFINISTDKAVRPKSYMGLSKRFAELLIEEMNRIHPTRFATVRFGNVAGSTGSVVQIFRQQIERGGPVTVTDARARRFFMSIPEAVRLVLQAAVFGEMAGIFVLDMGRPIEIYELARTMISLSGHLPNVDIPIEFTRLAGAEKLDEELQDDGELFCKTAHPRVMVIRKDHNHASAGFLAHLPHWQSLIRQGEFESLLDEVHHAWPAFRDGGKQRAAVAAAGVRA